MSKIWDLLKRMQAIGKQVNLRLAIVAVVLGVGGFAVYKGVQQLGPSVPTPKKVVKAGEEKGPGEAGLGAGPEAKLTSATEGPGTEEGTLYGAGAETQENGPPQYGAGAATEITVNDGSQPAETGGSAYGGGGNSTEQPEEGATAGETAARRTSSVPPRGPVEPALFTQ